MTASSSSKYDVFLSHSRVDKPDVEELARRLKQTGIEPFLDKWNLIPGDPWQEALEAALINSAACAVFVGTGGFSPWQNEELRAAIEHRVSGSRGGYRVIPVLLPGASQPDAAGLPRFLLRGTWVLFSRSLDDEQAFHSLVCGIRGIAPGLGLGQAIFEGECPYRGLEVFEEKHARFFFGREAQVDWLLSHRLAPMVESSHARRFLAILGPSGSGKSSLALAGLIPALKTGKVEGSAGWLIVVFRPGSNPLESLAIELSRAGLAESSAAAIQGLISSLLKDRTTLHLTARLALKAPAARLVVLADQFEEIFTLCNDEVLRRALIENLLHAATVVGGPVLVLLTMRVDFLGKCTADPDLAAALSDGQELVGPMSKEELRLAIERPAELAGCTLEPGLTDLLLQDVQGQAGALPLLEYTLLELWRERQGNRLSIAAYNGMGKVQGALEHRADAVLEGFRSRPGELEICRRIFLRLTQPGEGTEDTKRRAAFDELIASEAERPAVEEVVRKLADARLITTEGREGTARAGEQTGETEGRRHPAQQPGEGHSSCYVEVAHEALIRGWKQLRQWIDADRAGLRTHRQLTEAARDWLEHGRDESYLYLGSRLVVAREWSESHAPDLNLLEREFLDASLALRRRHENEKLEAARRLAEEAQAREEAERKRAEDAEAAAKRQRRLSRWALLAAVLAGVLAVAAGIQTRREARARDDATKAADKEFEARKQAEQNEKLAKSNETLVKTNEQLAQSEAHKARREADRARALLLNTQAKDLLSKQQPQTALLLAVEAERLLQKGDNNKPRVFPCEETLAVAIDSIGGHALTGHQDEATFVAFAPDGKTLASASQDSTVRLWDLTAADPNAAVRTLSGHQNTVTHVAFAPDGKTLASALTDMTVRLWDLTAGDPNAAVRTLTGHQSTVTHVAFAPDGKTLASASEDHTVRLWTVDLDELLKRAQPHAYRNLTREEWEQFFPGERYTPTFPDRPVPFPVRVHYRVPEWLRKRGVNTWPYPY